MKITEPYSPRLRANASENPVSHAGNNSGTMTRRNVVKRLAPSDTAASSGSRPNVSSTGCSVRTVNGRPMKTNASTMPGTA